MVLKHRVALDGIQLDEVDDRIMIQKIETGAGKETLSTATLGGTYGSRLTKLHRDYIDVTVRFTIRLRKTEMADRESVIEAVNAWAAAGGVLTVNYKEDRQIVVFLQTAAEAGDAWDWTKVYALTFRACGIPYWQSEETVYEIDVSSGSGSGSVTLNGSAGAVAECWYRNDSGDTINTLRIDAGDSYISFTGLGLADGRYLRIYYTDTGKRNVMHIESCTGTAVSGTSVLSKRAPGSSDELKMEPGENAVSVTAGGAGRLCLIYRERYL